MLNDGNGLHHFNFDLDRGIRSQVVGKLGNSPLLPWKTRRTTGERIYALYFKNRLVYIGKASREITKSKRTLRARLPSEHVGNDRCQRKPAAFHLECWFSCSPAQQG